jgi:hypothetical protein
MGETFGATSQSAFAKSLSNEILLVVLIRTSYSLGTARKKKVIGTFGEAGISLL